MDATDRALAHQALAQSCVGLHIVGANFGGTPILILAAKAGGRPYTSLSIYSRWALHEAEPGPLPPQRDAMPAAGMEDFVRVAASLRMHPIVAAELAEQAPHLLLRFANGQTLVVHGHHDEYESWEVSAGEICVVACPGDAVAVWLP